MGIETGNPAPKFSLTDDAGATVSSADLAGRWIVLYFYPRADTPGCTTEACEFTNELAAFERMGAEVVGVSPDDPPVLAEFRAKYGLGVRLLSDPDHQLLAACDAWGTKQMYGKDVVGVKRSTVLIDPEGRVAHHWTKVRAAGHAAAVESRLAELRSAK